MRLTYCGLHGVTIATTTALLPNQKKKDHADEHAAQARNAQLAVGHIQKPGKRALHATRMQERGYSFENEE
jgi:hypothetical protein